MNTMSDFRSEVEILYRACAMKNMQYNCYYRNSLVIVDLAMGQIPRSRISSSDNLFDPTDIKISLDALPRYR